MVPRSRLSRKIREFDPSPGSLRRKYNVLQNTILPSAQRLTQQQPQSAGVEWENAVTWPVSMIFLFGTGKKQARAATRLTGHYELASSGTPLECNAVSGFAKFLLPMSESGGKSVFLSYASQDATAARRICDALRAAGVEVWFDQSELRGGDAWDAKIRQRIKECALFMPVIQ